MGQSIPLKTNGGPPLVATNSSGGKKSTAVRKKYETHSGTETGFAKRLILADRVLHALGMAPSFGRVSSNVRRRLCEFW